MELENFVPRVMVVWNDPSRKEIKFVSVCLTHRDIPQFLVWNTPFGAYGVGSYDVYYNAEEIQAEVEKLTSRQ